MDNQFLAQTVLFRGSTPEQVNEMMKCFYAREKHFQKGEIILYMGDLVKDLGIVLSGSVTIERDDLLGNRSIFGHAGTDLCGNLRLCSRRTAHGQCRRGPRLRHSVSGHRAGTDHLSDHLQPPQPADPESAHGIRKKKSRIVRTHHAYISKIDPRTPDLLFFRPGSQGRKPEFFHSLQPPAACRLPGGRPQRPVGRA